MTLFRDPHSEDDAQDRSRFFAYAMIGLGVAVLVSNLAARSQRIAAVSQANARATERLYGFSRKLAGWQVADHMRTELVEDALRAAARDRGSLAGAVFHSDHGSVYASKAYAALCEQLTVVQSMGAVGTSADNSLAESFNAALKRELLEGRAAFPDQATAYRAVFRWANRYNTRRRHSTIGQVSPNSYENAYDAARSATLTEAA